VFQVASHEGKIPLDELYAACRHARRILDPYRVGRVIARPFVGKPGSFVRTYNRHDFSMVPDRPTVLTAIERAGLAVIGIGKIRDIYAGVGITRSVSTSGNQDSLEQTLDILGQVPSGLIFVNLVDYDMNFGHRRDPVGYARALELFDAYLAHILSRLSPQDLLLLTADHGCDPTFSAHTDHTREYVPLLMTSPSFRSGKDLGIRESFADLGATVAKALGVYWSGPGKSFLPS